MRDYWKNRAKQYDARFIKIKNYLKTNLFIDFFWSVRYAEQYFLKKYINNNDVVLDVACGAGKEILVKKAKKVIGIDISGYPKNIALSKGYYKCLEYEYLDYKIEINDKDIDIVTAINLNAYVSFEVFKKILFNALKNLKKDGKILLIAELDNDGIGYRVMKKISPSKFKRYVLGMQHNFLEYEDTLKQKIEKEFPNLKLLYERDLVIMSPFSRYLAFCCNKNIDNIILKILSYLVDIPISLFNNLYIIFNNRPRKSFFKGTCL